MPTTDVRRLSLVIGAVIILAIVIVVVAVSLAPPLPGVTGAPATIRPPVPVAAPRVQAPGWGTIGFYRPAGIDIAPNGDIYVFARVRLPERDPEGFTQNTSFNFIYVYRTIDPAQPPAPDNLNLTEAVLGEGTIRDGVFDAANRLAYVTTAGDDSEANNFLRVYRWSAESPSLAHLGERAVFLRGAPRDNVALHNGEVYVPRRDPHRVDVVNPATGHVVRSITAGADFQPRSVAVHPQNNHLLVYSTGDDKVWVMSLQGELRSKFGEGLLTVRDILVAPDGRVFLADSGEVRQPGGSRTGSVTVYDAGYNQLQRVNGAPDQPFNEAKGLALDSRGYLYVTDYYNSNVKVFRADSLDYVTRFPR
jgi:DNA-binding beta-propeller fold protein YncE